MNEPGTPVRRAYQVYVYAVCLATVLVTLFATWQAVYGVVRVAVPSTTAKTEAPGAFSVPFFGDANVGAVDEDAERDRGVAQLIENGLLALLAGAVFAVHWGWAGRLRQQAPPVPPPAPEEPTERPQRRTTPRSRTRPATRPKRRPDDEEE